MGFFVEPFDDLELLSFNEGMAVKAERISHAAQHPDIDFLIDFKFLIEIAHLGRPVHQGRVLGKPL